MNILITKPALPQTVQYVITESIPEILKQQINEKKNENRENI